MTALGLDPVHFRLRVIRPTLALLALGGRVPEDLLLGTAIVESALRFLDQGDPAVTGTALGLYQIEPATHYDLKRWCGHQIRWEMALGRLMTQQPADEQLVTNLAYATAVARLLYYRRPEPLPAAGDVEGYAAYYKQWFNTPAGKGTAAGFVAKAGPYL